MKTSLFMALIAIVATFSMGAHAKPPSPPAAIPSVIKVIVCSTLTSIELEDLVELDHLEIISFDEMTNEVCTAAK